MDITAKAQNQVDLILKDSEFLKISVDGGGCSGFKIGMKKEIEKDSTDIWVTHHIAVDSISEGYLLEATLDWKTDMFQPSYSFSVENASSCGCGTSFQFNT